MSKRTSYIIQNHGPSGWWDVEEDGNLARAKHTAKDSAEVTGEDHRVVRLVIDPRFVPIIYKGKKS
jgi:hypothetical protein